MAHITWTLTTNRDIRKEGEARQFHASGIDWHSPLPPAFHQPSTRASPTATGAGKFGGTIHHSSFYLVYILDVGVSQNSEARSLFLTLRTHTKEVLPTLITIVSNSYLCFLFPYTRDIISLFVLLVNALQGTNCISFLKLFLRIHWHLPSSFLHVIIKHKDIAVTPKSNDSTYSHLFAAFLFRSM